MTKATVLRVLDLGNDRLQVEGYVDGVTNEDGTPALVVATGWVSAMTNHYDESAWYTAEEAAQMAEKAPDADPTAYADHTSHRRPDAEPREMTDDEKADYWRSLLVDNAPVQAPAETVLFQAEGA